MCFKYHAHFYVTLPDVLKQQQQQKYSNLLMTQCCMVEKFDFAIKFLLISEVILKHCLLRAYNY